MDVMDIFLAKYKAKLELTVTDLIILCSVSKDITVFGIFFEKY